MSFLLLSPKKNSKTLKTGKQQQQKNSANKQKKKRKKKRKPVRQKPNKETTHTYTSKQTNKHGVCSMLVSYSWALAPSWSMLNIRSDNSYIFWFSFSQEEINSFLVRGQTLGPLPLFNAGTVSGSSLGKSCARGHSLSVGVLVCVSVLLCLKDAVSWELFTSSGSQNPPTSSSASTLEPWGEGFDKDFLFRTEGS